MTTASRIVETAPLHGVDLAKIDVMLPHQVPAPIRTPSPDQLDPGGVLATEPLAEKSLSLWRDIDRYPLPPLLDGSRDDLSAERERLAAEATRILESLQRRAAGQGPLDRGFQRKTLYVTTTGEFRVPQNLPKALHAGPFRPGARFRAILRFSSASASVQADTEKDQRALGVRITDDAGRVQDLTFTSGAAGNHARSARQFNSSMAAAAEMTGGGLGGKVRGVLGLLRREGVRETRRMSRARKEAVAADVSLAAMAYYSRSPLELGTKLVHLAVLPLEGTPTALVHEARGARDGLGRDLCIRRSEGGIRFRIVASEAPGLDDMSRAPEGPWITIGEIDLPRQRTSEADMLVAAAKVHGELAMHPFNLWEPGVLTPRGELNEILRWPVYRASARASGRSDAPPATPQHRA